MQHMRPNETLNDALNRLTDLKAPPPPRLNVAEWIAKQEAEQADLQAMYDYIARLTYRRYESFINAGFSPSAAFELTKLHTAP